MNYFKADPMAEIKGLVMWIPDHTQTVTLSVFFFVVVQSYTMSLPL